MLRSYFITAIRNIWKQRGYNALNIFGLAIGVAAASLIFLWMEDELTWNHYFPNRENIYTVKTNHSYDGVTFTFDETPGPMAQAMKSEIAGVNFSARADHGSTVLFSIGEKRIYETGNYVDSSFFNIFKFHFIYGDPVKAFQTLETVVISQKMSKQFFGSDNPVGRTIRVNNEKDFIVGAVFDDLPANTSFKSAFTGFQTNWFSPFTLYEEQNKWLQSWGNNGIVTYVSLNPNTNKTSVDRQLFNYITSKDSNKYISSFLFPMDKWHLHDKFFNGKEDGGKIQYVKLFSTIAWIILLIACINFMNLATARSEKRAKEVGVRKVVGAGRRSLITQFLFESLLMSLCAGLFAILLVFLILPYFNTMVEKRLSLDFLNPIHFIFWLSIIILCGLMAGSYPAFYLSSFNPVYVLKGIRIKTAVGATNIRKGLVVAQFTISVILIISTILIYQQIVHVRSRDLGYDKDQLIYLRLRGNMKNHFEAIKNDLIASGQVINASLSKSSILQMGTNTGDLSWEGKDPEKKVLITIENISPEHISTAGLHLLKGRDFSSNIKADSNNIIINETLAKIIDKKEILGTQIRQDSSLFTIVGVVKDYLYNNFYKNPVPIVLFCDTSDVFFLTIRMKATDRPKNALSTISSILEKNNPGYPVDIKFVDEDFGKSFKAELLVQRLSSVFAFLAILISCLGLFGLAAFTAEQRTKEIGIRKVLGASVQNLVTLLSKDFMQLIIISCLIAFPVAWWYIYHWLQNFDYRIDIHWWIFIIAAFIAAFIALITVGIQAIRAAMANPVKNLRSE